jgi:hypothetical protein
LSKHLQRSGGTTVTQNATKSALPIELQTAQQWDEERWSYPFVLPGLYHPDAGPFCDGFEYASVRKAG